MALRYSVATAAAGSVTFGVLVLMTVLISHEAGAIAFRAPPKFLPPPAFQPPKPQTQRLTRPLPPPPPVRPPSTSTAALAVKMDPIEPTRAPAPPGRDLIPSGIIDIDTSGPASDGPAVLIVGPRPIFPQRMLARGVAGTVVVRFDVGRDGLTENAEIVSSSHPGFENAARDAIARFRYRPRYVDGQPVKTTGLLRQFRFEIEP